MRAAVAAPPCSPLPPHTHPLRSRAVETARTAPAEPVGGAQLAFPPQQGGAPQRHHRIVTAHLFKISLLTPNCELSSRLYSALDFLTIWCTG